MRRKRQYAGRTVRLAVKRPLRDVLPSQYIGARLGLAPNWIIRLVEAGRVRAGAETVESDSPLSLAPGDAIEVRFPEAWPPHMRPVPMELAVLYEDDCLLVLDKPPGVVVHPARGHMEGDTLQNGVLYRYRDRLDDPDATVGPAHRLDRDTSGVLVFSRTREAYRHLVGQFAASTVRKEYLLLAEGRADFDATETRAPLGVHPDDPSRGAVVPLHEGGKEARTAFHLLETGAGWSYLRAIPHTGRPHQVRLHARHLGHPVLGDRDYHPDPDRFGAPRQALHARALRLRHPATGETLRFDAPLPADLTDLLERLQAGPAPINASVSDRLA